MKRHPSTSSWIVCVVLLLSGCGGVNHDMTTLSLRITTQVAPAGATAVQYNAKNGFTLAAEGGTPPYKWSWAPALNSGLPPGLRLNGNAISGTPQASGEFAVVVTVTDSGQPAAQTSATYTVSVDATLAIASGTPPSGTVGVGYGPIGTIYLKCVWSSVGGVHQICSRCDPSISGSCPANRTNCSYPLTCTKAVQGHVGFTFTATGGAAPYTWTGTGLPPGLGLYPKFGIMSGTPTTAGTYNITITAKDSEPTPHQIEAKYSIAISSSTPKYTLNGYCLSFTAEGDRGVCKEFLDTAACPVGTPAKIVTADRICFDRLEDTSHPCDSVFGHCGVTSTSATAPQSLSGHADREIPPLRLDTLPGISGSSADSADEQ